MISEKILRRKLNIIKYPIITDKTTKSIESNVYYFKVEIHSKKNEIKEAVEKFFDVKVKKINTNIVTSKDKNIGKIKGEIKKYKKAIIKLHNTDKINLFDNN